LIVINPRSFKWL